ncbi:MAG: hypothetical protein WKG00_18510 [Polyangiaceae bacterium]
MQELPARTLVVVVAALAAVSVLPRLARADDAEPIRIELQAHAGCPDAAAFTGEIRARTARARVAAESESARTFSVRIEPAGKGSRGKLTIRSLDGQSSIREVSGKTCAEVTSALALISALAIDPRASTAATPPPVPPGPVGPTGPPPTPPPTGPAPLSGAAPPGALLSAMPGDLAPPLALPLPIAAEQAPEPIARWRFSVGQEIVGLAGPSKGMSQGLSLYLDATRADPGFWAPSLRVSLTRASSGIVPTSAGDASFRLTSLRGDFCPLRLGPDDIAVRLCATGEAGALEGYGFVYAVRPWFTIGGLGRLQWVMLDFLQLDVFGGLNLPLIRHKFYFPTVDDPDVHVPIHEVPWAGGLGGVGVGIRFHDQAGRKRPSWAHG